MQGGRVIVKRPISTGKDAHGNLITTFEEEAVDNVLVNTPETAEAFASARQNDFSISYTLGFPKTYKKSLLNCRIIIPFVDPEKEWYVFGDPQPVPHNCPTKWNRKVSVSAYD